MRSEDLKVSVIAIVLGVCILGMSICLTILGNVQAGISSSERIKLTEMQYKYVVKE